MSSSPLRRQPARRVLAVLASVALAAALAACSATDDDQTAATAGDTGVLKWAASYSPSSWDPVVAGSGAGFRINALAYASLTEVDENGEAAPGLAESWDYNDDGTQVTFHLREGLTFSDGTALDSAAVKAYYERAQTQEDSALLAEGIAPIASIDTPNDLDVVFNLSEPDYQIPLVVAERVGQITNPNKTPEELNASPDGAGPFTVVSIVAGASAVFEKNPNYWDADNIHIARVEVTFGVDSSSIVSGLQTGVYNFSDLDPSQVDAAEAAGLDVVEQPGFNASNLSVNRTIAPFDDPLVFEAVQYAIDRDQLLEQASFGHGTTTTEPFPEGYIAYSDDAANQYSYDPDKAKELLAEAGYPDGFDVDFVVSADTTQNELLQAQLAAVGINATLSVDTNWSASFFAKKLTLTTYGTTGRDSPIQTLTAHFSAEGALNSSGVDAGDAFQAALSTALATPLDSDDYATNIQAATAAGLANTGLIFLVSQPNLFVKTSAVSDIPAIPAYVTWTGVTIADS
ncbi:MAG: ABC transporter substrate-binding protein [Microbacteriaceae bacterium]